MSIMYDTISINVWCSNFINTATAIRRVCHHKQPNVRLVPTFCGINFLQWLKSLAQSSDHSCWIFQKIIWKLNFTQEYPCNRAKYSNNPHLQRDLKYSKFILCLVIELIKNSSFIASVLSSHWWVWGKGESEELTRKIVLLVRQLYWSCEYEWIEQRRQYHNLIQNP